ncbi:MAG: polysaccharide biosynthesis tyrosine autokinase [Thermodesulfobacteriota bacterium]
MAQYDIDLRDYWRVVKKRKSIVILTVILAGLFSFAFAKFSAPAPLYEATASVKIEKVSSMGDMLLSTFTWSSGDNIATQAAIITSFPVLEQAAKRLNWIPADIPGDKIQQDKAYMSKIERLKNMVRTEQEKQTSIINIIVKSNDHQEAYQVAKAVTECYRDFNIQERNLQTIKQKEFLQERVRLVSANLQNAEEALRAFKKDNEAMALDQQAHFLMSQLDTMQRYYAQDNKIKVGKIEDLAKINNTPDIEMRITETFHAEDPTSLLRELAGRVSQLTAQRTTLLQDLTPENPQVREIQGRIDGLIDEVKQEISSQIKQLEQREEYYTSEMTKLQAQIDVLPDKAQQLAKLELAVSLDRSLYEELETKYQETLIQDAGKIEEVTILQPPLESTKPVNLPSKLMATLTGAIIGLILGMVLAFVTETLDTSIGTIEDVESYLSVPVLGVIPYSGAGAKQPEKGVSPKEPARGGAGLVAHFEPKSLTAEAYRSLRTNLQFIGLSKGSKVFLLTSSTLQEGKTFNAANLALSLAQAGEKVLLVEADLRRPSTYRIFGVSKEPGLTDFVIGNYAWRDVVKSMVDVMLGDYSFDDVMMTPGMDNLHIITGGVAPPNPTEILRSERFASFLEEARKEYDVVIIDGTPVLPVADASVVATMVDGVIIVYEVGKVARGLLKRAKLSLDTVSANVLGVVLNNIKPDVSPDFYGYKYGYYAYHGVEQKPETGGKKKLLAALSVFFTR